MYKIYLVPGIGADTRIFCKINLEGFGVIRCEWIKPASKLSLADYAQLLVKQYNIQTNSIIIGNSLGGMIAIEIAKLVTVSRVIIISSMKTGEEAPGYFSFFRRFPLYSYIPVKALLKAGLFIAGLFRLMPAGDIDLFKSMTANSNDDSISWGMYAALNWQNAHIPANLVQINGDHDLVFPLKSIKDTVVIKKGTHLMVYNKADEINEILTSLLS